MSAEQMWLHVDAAYGGPALITDAGAALLRGIDRADSIAIDPHKWLFQPYECGVVLVRRPGALAGAFALHPEYLADVSGRTGEVKVYGLAAIRRAIEHGIATAERAEELLRSAGWTIHTPAQLGIVSFRREQPEEDEEATAARHLRAVVEMQQEGVAAISSTVLHGITVLRMCTINPGTTEDDLQETIAALDRAWRRAAA